MLDEKKDEKEQSKGATTILKNEQHQEIDSN